MSVVDRWFNSIHLNIRNQICLDDLHGYVLPHASTAYTGNIISHTLQFKPTKKFTRIAILYYPASKKEDAGAFYHEYYVPWQSLLFVISKVWKLTHPITFEPYNIRDSPLTKRFGRNTLVVVSADFSHFLPFQEAIDRENIAAHALTFKQTDPVFTDRIVDDPRTFDALFNHVPKKYMLQWVGRTRSPGPKGVGYLSFLLRDQHTANQPNGIFVTCFDQQMHPRECLGDWSSYTAAKERALIKRVVSLGSTMSRLQGGRYTDVPIAYYTVSYLYRDTGAKFIRGWHAILKNATYLSDVFLEHTFENGHWIDRDNQWQSSSQVFQMADTLQQLTNKAGGSASSAPIQLFSTHVRHVSM